MDSLDLTRQAPRSPRALLPGLNLVMIARTVDKLRATLPGGNLGSYQIPGFSGHLLKQLGISDQALRDAVANAASDDDVAAWIRDNSDPAAYAAINAEFDAMKIADRLNDAQWMARYPIATTLPPETSRLDLLVADDADMFPPCRS